MKPTKEEYKALADILGDALDHCDGVGLYGDNLFTAYKALRLVAALPSEEEIAISICQSGQFETGQGTRLAARILERIRSVK